MAGTIPELEGEARAAVLHRGSNMQIIASAGSGKTEAQERLIELLAGPTTELCVVGDDDQAIYQWRGSNVNNIVEFAKRYAPVRTFTVVTNWRSRPQIIRTANGFATSIPNRIDKRRRRGVSGHRSSDRSSRWNRASCMPSTRGRRRCG